MDNFAKNAFAQAQEIADKREAEAYGKYMIEHGKQADLASLLDAGIRESALLIALVDKAGMMDTLRKYADNMLMSGFNGGYQAGYLNGMEDAK